MFVITYQYGSEMGCEVVFGEENAKKRYWELDDLYMEVHLLKVEKEIMM